MKKTLLILLILTGIIAGCKKYKDGPWISLRSAYDRLYGYHTLTRYTVDGADSLNTYNDSLGLTFHFLYDEYNDITAGEISGKRKDGTGCYPIGWRWNFKKNKKILNVYMSLSLTAGIGPFGNNKTMEWEILKLKWHDIIMKTTFHNKEYLIELTGG